MEEISKIVLIIIINGVQGKIHRHYAAEGREANMECHYNAEENTLVKWYKDLEQFYNYDTFDNDTMGMLMDHKDFPYEKVEVKNKGQEITLKNITKRMEGTYECEVTKENRNAGPPFIIEKIRSSLKVITLSKTNPIANIEIKDNIISLTCRYQAPEHIKTQITWYKNKYCVQRNSFLYSPNHLMLESSYSLPENNDNEQLICKIKKLLYSGTRWITIHQEGLEIGMDITQRYLYKNSTKETRLYFSINNIIGNYKEALVRNEVIKEDIVRLQNPNNIKNSKSRKHAFPQILHSLILIWLFKRDGNTIINQ